MANRFPLTVDAATKTINEIPSGDYLDMSGGGVANLAVGNLQLTGGTSGQVLSTNGSGNLSWSSTALLSGTPYMYVQRAASQGLTNNVYNTLIWDTVVSDTASAYNATTGVYTVPATGYYNINTTVNMGGGIVSAVLTLYVNGVETIRFAQDNMNATSTTTGPFGPITTTTTAYASVWSRNGSILTQLTAGQQLSISVYSSSYNNVQAINGGGFLNWWTMKFISAL